MDKALTIYGLDLQTSALGASAYEWPYPSAIAEQMAYDSTVGVVEVLDLSEIGTSIHLDYVCDF